MKNNQYTSTPDWFKSSNVSSGGQTSSESSQSGGYGSFGLTIVIGGGGSSDSIEIIKTDETTVPTDDNVFSALRTLDEIETLLEKYLRKDIEDNAQEVITFDKGLNIGQYSTSVSGGTFVMDQDQHSYLEVDKLLVRLKATFEELQIKKVSYIGGELIVSAAGMTVEKVEEGEDYYRLYPNTDNNKPYENEFAIGDQVICKMADLSSGENISNRYYWRLVTQIGKNYIELSKTDADSGSDIPLVGDVIVQLGNRIDSQRQNAIMLSSVSADAPSIKLLHGIKSYTLENTEVISEGVDTVTGRAFKKIYGDFFVGDKDKSTYVKYDSEDKLLEIKGKFVTSNGLNIEDLLNQFQSQIDNSIETWFYEPIPTLSNEPAINWVTDNQKNAHLGDLYYSGEGKAYRFQKVGEVYNWLLILDTDITEALAQADAAKDAAENAQTVADAAKDRLDSWANDGVISPTEKAAVKDEIVRIDADKEHINDECTRYLLDDPIVFNNAYNIYRANLVALSAATPENIQIPEGFATSLTNFYNERTKQLSLIADAAKEIADTANAEAIKAFEAAGNAAIAAQEAKDATDGLKNFTDEAFADGIIDRAEATAIEKYINTVNETKASIKAKYDVLINNPYLLESPKETLTTNYTNLNNAIDSLINEINTAISDNVTTQTEKSLVDIAYGVFSNALKDYEQSIENANESIQNTLKSYIDQTDAKFQDYAYLKEALENNITTIEGGLISTSVILAGYRDSAGYHIKSGLNGVYDPDYFGGGISYAAGGRLIDRETFVNKDDIPEDAANAVIRMDGSGYLAKGNLTWDNEGILRADPLSFFIGEETVGDILKLFAPVYDEDNTTVIGVYSRYPLAVQGGITAYSGIPLTVPSIFEGLPIDGSTIYWDTSSANPVLKAKVNEGAISADVLWGLLEADTEEQINISHLTDALTGYATTTDLASKWTTDSTKISNWDDAYDKKHTHDNKTVLDGIEAADITNWDTAYTNNHTHDNKSVLDGITSTLVTNWNTAYGWGDHSVAGYAHLENEEEFTGLKHFTAGLSVGVSKKSIYEEDGVVYIDADVAITGGVTAYALGNKDISTIMDGVAVDEVTLTKGTDNVIRIKNAGSGSTFDEDAMWIALLSKGEKQIDKSHLTTALDGYATELWVTNKGYITSYINNYLTGVSGSGNGTVTFTIEGLDDITWDSSHNHNSLYVSALSVEDNSLVWTKNGINNKITIPYAENANTANKLKNSVTLWGQSFNGESNVSGSLIDVIDITGSGTFSSGNVKTTDSVYINGIRLHKTQDGVIKLEGNLAVSGGITAYAIDEVDIPTIMDGVVADETTITNDNGVLKIKNAGSGSSFDEDAMWLALSSETTNQINKAHLTTALTGYATITDVDDRIDDLVNGAPAAFDTLKEIADVLQGNVDSIGDIIETLGTKWTQDDDKIAHWDDAYDKRHTHNNKTVIDDITSTLITNWNTAYKNNHTHSNKTVLDGITSTKVTNWNKAYGWGNHADAGYALKTYVDEELKKYVTLADEQTIAGLKHFTNGLTIGTNKHKIYEQDGNIILDGNLLVTGGITAYSDGTSSGGSGGGIDVEVLWEILGGEGEQQINVAHLTDALTWDNVSNKPSTFTPSAHKHAIADVTNLSTELGKKVSSVTVTGTGNAITAASVANGVLTLTKGATYNNYSLPLASSTVRGGVKVGYAENGRNYPVELSNEKMFVNVPWTDTKYTLSSFGITATAAEINKLDGATITTTELNYLDGVTSNVQTQLNNSFKEAYLQWGGKNFAGSYGCIDAAMIPDLGANRLAFMPADSIEVQYSRDGGVTWSDYPTSDTAKLNFFNGNGASHVIGANSSTGIDKSKYQLRFIITTNTAKVYTVLNKFCIYCSTNGSNGSWCTIDAKTKSNVDAGNDTWTIFANKVPISGWSGYNIINTSGITTYGNQAYYFQKLRFTFGVSSHLSTSKYSGLSVSKIYGFGGVGWATPSNMARYGRIYSYDSQQNVTFPGSVTATEFSGLVGGYTASRALVSNSSGKIAVSAVTSTELGYLDGVTSNIQTQLNTKLNSSSYTASDILTKLKTVHGANSGLDADLLDGTHKSGLFTALSSNATTNLSITIGGTTKSISDLAANTAAKLQTARTLWGKSFDGSANVTGALTSVTDITGSGTFTSANTKVTDSVYINGIRLYKSADGTIKIDGNLLVTGGITAYSTGEEGGGSSGGGIDVELLWEILGGEGEQQINIAHLTDALTGYATQSWVTSQNYLKSVSLATISDLHSSWDALLKSAPSVYVTRHPTISEVTGKQNLIIKLNSGTTEGTNLFTYNGTAAKTVNITPSAIGAAASSHNHSWSNITSGKPTTLSGYGITDGVNAVSVTGTGNAITSASISGHTLTLTKGSTFSLSGHTHTFASLTSKPTTLAGYGISANDVLATLKTVNGVNSGLDADTVDGVHNGSLTASNLATQGKKTAISGTTFPSTGIRLYEVYSNGYPTNYGNLLSVRGGGCGELLLAWKGTNRIYYRSRSDVGAETWQDWSTVAFLDDNVASASKLATSRTIWGQSFNGENNVSGNLTNVNTILSGANNTYNIGSSSNVFRSIYTTWLVGGTNRELILGANDTSQLWIKTNGNVGVGTDNPTYKMHVNGSFYTTHCLIGDIAINRTSTGTQTTGVIECYGQPLYLNYYSNKNIILGIGGGYTGINTSSPAYKLDVNGDIIASSWIRTRGQTGWYSETYGGGIYMDDSSYVKVWNYKKFHVDSPGSSDAFNTNGGYHSSWNNVYTLTNYNTLNPDYANFNTPSRAVNPNTVQPILAWSSIVNNYGYITRCSISSVRLLNDGWGRMRLAVGASDNGTVIGCYLDLHGNGKAELHGNFLVTGGITCYSSDQRAKTVIEQISLSLKQIADAPTIRFKWNDWKIKDDGKTHIGGIAQYIQKLLPETVLEADDMLNMDYATTGYIFAVQTARHLLKTDSEVDKLKKEVKRLKKRIKELEMKDN